MANRVLLSLVLGSTALLGQTAKPAHTVRASGDATVVAQPDRAEISAAISTTEPAAETAADQNARQTAQVLDALKHIIEGSGTLKTTGYSINPEYQYEQGRPPQLTGYRANNSVLVTVDNLSLIGKIIDTAAQSGANSIAGVSFTLRDDTALRSQALAKAAGKARENAEAMAKALNLRVIGILDAETTDAPTLRPLPMMAQRAMAQTVTPIETGTLDIRASVVVTLEVQ